MHFLTTVSGACHNFSHPVENSCEKLKAPILYICLQFFVKNDEIDVFFKKGLTGGAIKAHRRLPRR